MRLSLVILFFLLACVPDKNFILVKNTGRAQGTFYHIQYISYEGKDYQKSIDSILTKIDMSLSIYNQHSLISQLNRGFLVNPDKFLIDVFLAAEKVYNETDGYFDCTAYPLVKEWGFYVEINDIKCEGLVKISSLKNDYYLYNEKSHSIYGKSSNKTYRLGDEVNVKIKNCNLQKKQSDFICIS